jgi:hypothetical protein
MVSGVLGAGLRSRSCLAPAAALSWLFFDLCRPEEIQLEG